MEKTNEIYNYLIENEIVSEETLNCITSINGYNEETLNSVIYWATGYRSIEQLKQYEEEEEEEEV